MRLRASRAVTEEDIRGFTDLSGDAGRHHVVPDAQGRLMAHGLLTASLATRLGGQLNFMAREMHFEFLRAVYAGDTIHCEGVVESVVRKPLSLRVAFRFEIKNQDGALVLRGTSAGVILREGAGRR